VLDYQVSAWPYCLGFSDIVPQLVLDAATHDTCQIQTMFRTDGFKPCEDHHPSEVLSDSHTRSTNLIDENVASLDIAVDHIVLV
jgi:hypothetical protein